MYEKHSKMNTLGKIMEGSRMVLKTPKKISFIESIRKYLVTFCFYFFKQIYFKDLRTC